MPKADASSRDRPHAGGANDIAITLHLGAHRTGSTRAQNQIAAWGRMGLLDDIDIFGPKLLRRTANRVGGLADRVPAARPLISPLWLRLLEPALARRAADRSRALIISDEVLLGRIDNSLLGGKGLYPEAPVRIAALRRLLGKRRVRPVLGVRAYADWFASAYAMTLRRRALPPAESLAGDWARLPRGWPDIVDELMAAFERCDVVPMEAVAADPTALMRALLERPPPAPPRDVRSMPSMSAPAVAEVQAGRARGVRYGIAEIEEIEAKHADGPALQPFPEETRDVLDARYRADLETVRGMGARVWPLDHAPAN